TCTLPCHFTAGGYLTIRVPGGRHVHLRSARLAFTGTRALRLRLGKADRRTLSRTLARRPVQARLTLSAARAEFLHEGTAGTSQAHRRPWNAMERPTLVTRGEIVSAMPARTPSVSVRVTACCSTAPGLR